jgi:hypothetical protein
MLVSYSGQVREQQVLHEVIQRRFALPLAAAGEIVRFTDGSTVAEPPCVTAVEATGEFC